MIDQQIADFRSAIVHNSGPEINNYGGAIAVLSSAGTVAATQLGPAIDAESGNDQRVTKMTYWAWTNNSKIATYPTDTATRDQLDSVAALARQMLDWYSQSHRLALSFHYKAPYQAPVIRGPGSIPYHSASYPTSSYPTSYPASFPASFPTSYPSSAYPIPLSTTSSLDKPWWRRFLEWLELA